MDPVLKAVLLSWNWRLDIIIVLALAGTLYVRGWRTLRARTVSAVRRTQRRRGQLAERWRLTAYLMGLAFSALALLSPIDALGQQLFFMHMIQHLLLIMIAPPLLLIANPMPFLLWGLPTVGRERLGRGLSRLLHREASFRAGLRRLTTPGALWLVWVVAVVAWHDPVAYNTALQFELVHDLEHLSFFVASMLFWWYVTGAGPHIHKRFGLIGRIAFLLAAVPPNMFTGVVLAMAREPLYTYYAAVPRLWQIDLLTDQQIGGVIMWVPGSMMFVIAALILMTRLLQSEDAKPALTESEWATDESLAAPGIKK